VTETDALKCMFPKGKLGVIILQNTLAAADKGEVLCIQKLRKTTLSIFMFLFIDFEGCCFFFFFFTCSLSNSHSVHGAGKHSQ